MITLSQDELHQIEAQLKEVVLNVMVHAEGFVSGIAANPHWVSQVDAIEKLGWAKILLKKGTDMGHLHPIKIPGTGGTKYDLEELTRYKRYLMAERRDNQLDHEYISKKTNNIKAQSQPDTHVLPDNSQKGRPGNRLPGRRKSVSR